MKVKQVLLGIIATAMVIGGSVAAATPAQAATPAGPANGWESWHNANTGRCIDDSDIGLRSFSCNGGVFQKWDVEFTGPSGQRWFTLRDQATGACLEDLSSGLFGGACNGVLNEAWELLEQANGSLVVKDVQTGRCLDDSVGAGLRSFSCNGLNFQNWFSQPA